MANLEPMPISSLPELDKLQDGDEAVIYRPSTGKAYQAPDLLQDLDSKVDAVEEKCKENTDLIDSLDGGNYFDSYSSFLEFTNQMERYKVHLVYITSAISNELLGINTAAKGFITKVFATDNAYDFFLIVGNGERIFAGRVQEGVQTTYQITTTAV